MQTASSSKFSHFLRTVLAVVTPLALLLSAASASSTKVIYAFTGGNDGEYLDTDLVIDNAGNLYGSTVQGGMYASRTVFELSPSATGWTQPALYNFPGTAPAPHPYKRPTPHTPPNISYTTT